MEYNKSEALHVAQALVKIGQGCLLLELRAVLSLATNLIMVDLAVERI